MRIYITDSQIPELAEFPPEARRILRQSAFQQMFARQPRLRWIPYTLCALGVLIGILTLHVLPSALFAWANGNVLAPNGYVLLLAALGGAVGVQYLIHCARHYLREIVSPDAYDK